jgi:hypothetical protein
MEIGDDQTAPPIDDNARTSGHNRLKGFVGHSRIAAEERILQKRVLLRGGGQQRRDADDGRSGLAHQGREAVVGGAGEHPRSRIGLTTWNQPRYDSTQKRGDEHQQ